MESHYEATFDVVLKDINDEAERLTARIAKNAKNLGHDDGERLARLMTRREQVQEMRSYLNTACTRAATEREQKRSEGLVYVAVDQANGPEIVTSLELADWFRDTGEPVRVHLYVRGPSEKLTEVYSMTWKVSQDDAFAYWKTRISYAAGVTVNGENLIEEFDWDEKIA